MLDGIDLASPHDRFQVQIDPDRSVAPCHYDGDGGVSWLWYYRAREDCQLFRASGPGALVVRGCGIGRAVVGSVGVRLLHGWQERDPQGCMGRVGHWTAS